MAKSKSGGSRSYLRGKLGSDVYSIGKDGKGKKQQVVRALAETVANPQTQAQMRGRMIMSTVMQAQSQLTQIIDHSFDGFPAGQPSISQFIRENYSRIKADVAAHASTGNTFGLVKYGEKGIKGGAYLIADGRAALPSGCRYNATNSKFELATLDTSATAADLIAALGLTADDYITVVAIKNDNTASFVRLRADGSVESDAPITTTLLNNMFSTEGTERVTFSFTAGVVACTLSGTLVAGGMIVSRKSGDGFTHNKAIMTVSANPQWTSAVAFPTYPLGSAKFLNGGDVPGYIVD